MSEALRLADMVQGVRAPYCGAAAAELRRLSAELDKVRKDAERYRWLQKEHERHDPMCHLSWKKNNDRNGAEWVNTAKLDTAIDAAMKGTP